MPEKSRFQFDWSASIPACPRSASGVSKIKIAAARAHIADAADPVAAAILTAHNIPPAFFTALLAKTNAFEQRINTAESIRGERVGTNAAFKDPARRGKKLVNKIAPAVKRK